MIKRKMKIISVVGARPNFVKISPFIKELKKYKNINNILIHTGQHYTQYMAQLFIKEFKLSKCLSLRINTSDSVKQFCQIMKNLEKIFFKEKPDLVVVVGDVNSTLAAALAAAKLNIKVAHIEAGLRSFDMNMPEEINRILTDALSEYLFATEPDAVKNLKEEGIPRKKIFFVGNIMIDSLKNSLKQARKRKIAGKMGLSDSKYILLTLHRPSNVDKRNNLAKLIKLMEDVSRKVKIIYPVHPRTKKMLKKFGLWKKINKIRDIKLIMPLGYIDFLSLMLGAKAVITDSGGMQEETTYLGIPCYTLRRNTERPITVTEGTNKVIGENYPLILKLLSINKTVRRKKRPKYWDGRTAVRIVKILTERLGE